jgi:hypothetical protein
MLWHKGWLETRFRLLFAVGLAGFFLFSAYGFGVKAPAALRAVIGNVALVAAVLSAMLAGSGIATQPAVQATRGLHGSMLFTLALPVTRLRLLAVRAGLGWLEMCGGIGLLCAAMWTLFPLLRSASTPKEMIQYALTIAACASGLHAITVLLATFLDDLWRMYGSMIAYAAVWWIPNHTDAPAAVNIFRAMGEGSPLIAHTMPWNAIAFSLLLACGLFFAALQIVRRREY